MYVSGTSPETMHNLLSEVAEYGTYYTRLSRFSLQPVLDSSYSKGLVFQVKHCVKSSRYNGSVTVGTEGNLDFV